MHRSAHRPTSCSATPRRGNALVLVLVVVALVGAALFLLFAPGEGDGGTARLADEPVATAEEKDAGPVELSTDAGTSDDARRAAEEAVDDDGVAEVDEPRAVATSTVTGRVTDASGLPVGGARVSLARAGFGANMFVIGSPLGGEREVEAVETDARGEFLLESRARGERVLRVERSGFVRHETEELELVRGGTRDVGTIVLDAAVLLSGRVVDPSGRGIADVGLYEIPTQVSGGMVFAMEARVNGEPMVTTGPAGEFTIDTLPAGPWKVQAQHPEHPWRSFDGTTERAGDVQRDLVFELPYGARIAGHVSGTDRREGPFHVVARKGGGVAFLASPPKVDVAEDGSFEFTGLEADTTYELQVLRDPDALDDSPREFVNIPGMGDALSESVSVAAGTLDAQLAILDAGRIRVQVTAGDPARPLERFTASFGENWNLRALRGEDGRVLEEHTDGVVVFDDVSSIGSDLPWAQSKVVRIEADGHLQLDLPVPNLPAPGEVLDLGTVVLEPASGARITVVAEGRPVVGAQVSIGRATDRGFEVEGGGVARSITIDASDDGSSEVETIGGGEQSRGRTDDEGVAQLDLPSKSGSFRLAVRHGDWAPYFATVEVPPGATLDHTVELGPGGEVLVRVLDPQGVPMEGVDVSHRAPGNRGLAAMFGNARKSDENGEVRFARLTPGTHRFRTQPDRGDGPMAFVAFDDQGEGDWNPVVVEHGTRTELVLTDVASASLVGQVREDGVPLVGANVRLRPKRDPNASGPAGMDMFGFGGGPSGTTDADGRFAIDSVKAELQELVVTHPDRALPAVFEIAVVPGVENVHDVDLYRNGIRGVVRDTAGNPLVGLTVRARRAEDGDSPMGGFMAITADIGGGAVSVFEGAASATVRTDADGRYELVGLPEDVEVQVVVDASNEEPFTFAVESDPLRVGAGEWVEGVDLVAPPAGSLRIDVSKEIRKELFFLIAHAERLDDAGVPIAGSSRTGFGDDGAVTMDGLEPGRYRVRLENPGPGDSTAPRHEREVVVAEGERATLVFE